VVVLVVAAVAVVVVVVMVMVEGTEFGSAYTHRSHVGSCLLHPFCGIPQCLCVCPSSNLDCRPDGVMRVQDMLCELTRSLAKMRSAQEGSQK
jgi:Fe-S-cluster-containing dehydrogenase component